MTRDEVKAHMEKHEPIFTALESLDLDTLETIRFKDVQVGDLAVWEDFTGIFLQSPRRWNNPILILSTLIKINGTKENVTMALHEVRAKFGMDPVYKRYA